FYQQLQSSYKDVEDFLQKLNDESICKKPPTVGNQKADHVDFTKNEIDKTFSRTEYCRACPWCGVQKKSNGGNGWEPKSDTTCAKRNKKEYYPEKTTTIEILTGDKTKGDMVKKYNKFCNGNGGNGAPGTANGGAPGEKGDQMEKWQCYYDENRNKHASDSSGDSNICVLQKDKQNTEEENDRSYNSFFWKWVTEMLIDSIDWRKELKRCTNNQLTKCNNNKCNNDCKCYEKWVKQKEKEWKQIVDYFKTQPGFEIFSNNYNYALKALLNVEDILTNIKDGYKEVKGAEHIYQMLQKEKSQEAAVAGTGQKNTIDLLIEHELDEADLCLDTHLEDEDCSDDEEDHEEEVYVNNPCATPSGSRHRALANEAAHQMHEAAKTQLAIRAGRRTLKANASQGHYNGKGNVENLNGHICNIDKNHSNATGSSNDPCHGKDGGQVRVRMKIGTPWTNIVENPTLYKDDFLPPRRQHMCTSNLEHLNRNSKGLTGANASDSLLGDVLLSAKSEAKFIIDKYKGGNSPAAFQDDATICRAVRYSFADLGDIIRGRDMWDLDSGSKKMEGHLKKIFENIKNNHPAIKGNPKYKGDESKKPAYKLLRSDWWEANRHQVWKAMKCALKGEKINCGATPYDDYIPQRLRWMTEWSEWFCKMQKKEYEDLARDCGECKKNADLCIKDTRNCQKCDKQCKTYGDKIKQWEQQWDRMQVPYLILYKQAQNTAASDLPSLYGDLKNQYVIDFFKELQKTIKNSASKRSKRSTDAITTDPTTPYSSAAGYIHQEMGPNVGCNTQTRFCGESHKDYAFRHQPHDHDTACKCKENKPQPKSDVCTIVKNLLQGNDGKTQIAACYGKSHKEWFCNNGDVESIHIGACMPPRRKSLCIYNLTQPNETNTKENLRDAFIKCAAIETHFLWHKYKENDDKIEDLLKEGTIPEEFKRIMFYTFGDYRDLCLDTDISSKANKSTGVGKVKINIDAFFQKHGAKNVQERKMFWELNGPKIWEAMLCALSYDTKERNFKKEVHTKLNKNPEYTYSTVKFSDNKTTLDEFAKRPQFLRWFTEWSDEFCTERKKKEKKVSEDCKTDYDGCEKNKSGSCANACKAYNQYITNKKEEYDSQKGKFD
ncbi:hypothetical protein PFAG_05971, partial [Plasmodium falciparum Santa Lucia]